MVLHIFQDSVDECSICQDQINVQDEGREVLDGGHTFHSTCISRWIGRNPTCPNCRALHLTPHQKIERAMDEIRRVGKI
jgi:hypothetical protein